MPTLLARFVQILGQIYLFCTSSRELTLFQISTLFAADPVMTGINYGGKCLPTIIMVSYCLHSEDLADLGYSQI